jgi:glycosyltransferase involved in cell wall biosynthesis
MTSTRFRTVDIVLPVRNQEAALVAHVELLLDYLREDLPVRFKIVIADRASDDLTPRLAAALARAHPEVLALPLDQPGRGHALRWSWITSPAHIVSYVDIDLSANLRSVLPLVAPLVSGERDIVTGTRFAASGELSLRHEVVARGYNRILQTGFHSRVGDAQCGFKALRADVARRLVPLVRDDDRFFDTELLLLAERNGMRIEEVPVFAACDTADERLPAVRAELAGLWRLRRSFWRGEGLAPPAEVDVALAA